MNFLLETLESRWLLAASPLDPTFGDGGIVAANFPASRNDFARAVTIQPDGKIIVAGDSSGAFLLIRYNDNGSLDDSFGVGGIARSDFALPNGVHVYNVASSAVIDVAADGRIYVGEVADELTIERRFLPNGTPDVNFGTNSYVTVTRQTIHPQKLAFASGQRLIIAGESSDSDGNAAGDFAVARLTSDGQLDSSFGTDPVVEYETPVWGRRTIDFGGHDRASGLTVQADGKVLIIGNSDVADANVALARFNFDGTLDTTFDGDGKIIETNVNYFGAIGIATNTAGKIVLAGFDYDHYQFARYNADGSVDTAFAQSGIATEPTTARFETDTFGGLLISATGEMILAGIQNDTNFDVAFFDSNGQAQNDVRVPFAAAGESVTCRSAILDSSGRVICAGYFSSGNDYDVAVARLNPDGAFDASFNANGKLSTNIIAPSNDISQAMAIQPDGKIIVGGTSDGSFSVARFNADGTFDSSFGTDGSIPLDFPVTGLLVLPQGQILAGGGSYTGFYVARLNADGSRDLSFGDNGRIVGGYSHENVHLALEPDGTIIVGSSSRYTVGGHFQVRSYSSDGKLKTVFADPPGGSKTDFYGNYDFYNPGASIDVRVQPDGKALVLGMGDGSGYPPFYIARYNEDGTLDQSFGTRGAIYEVTMDPTPATALGLQSDGRIVVVTADKDSTGDSRLYRYLPDGSRDGTFGNVFGLQGISDVPDYMGQMTILSDDSILLAGTSFDGTLIRRLTPTGQFDTFSNIANFGGTAVAVGATNDGKYVTLSGHASGHADIVLERYLPVTTDIDPVHPDPIDVPVRFSIPPLAFTNVPLPPNPSPPAPPPPVAPPPPPLSKSLGIKLSTSSLRTDVFLDQKHNKGLSRITFRNESPLVLSGTAAVELFASRDDQLDSSDVSVGTASQSIRLKPNATRTLAVKLLFPVSMTDGTYMLIARGTAPDNLKTAAIVDVILPSSTPKLYRVAHPTFDLAAVNLVLPAVIGRAGAGRISFGVRNLGTTPASGSYTASLILSDDNVLDAADSTLSTFTHNFRITKSGLQKASMRFIAPLGETHAYTVFLKIEPVAPPVDLNLANNVISGQLLVQ